MKNLLQITSFLCVVIFNNTYAQCPQNTEPGSTVNVWDWKGESYEMYILEDNGSTNHVMIVSPFFSVNNTLQENVAHLSLPQDFDYEPGDGWELVYKNFGTSTYPVAEPSFSLYNRYNGLIRTFIWLTANEGNTYQAARLDINQYVDQIFPNNSALFSANQTPLSALDNFPKNTANTAINSYSESVGTWILSELTLMYDPCSCHHISAIRTKPSLTSLTNLDLNIIGTSQSSAIYAGGSNSSQSNGFTGILDASNDITAAIKEGQTVFKDLDNFATFINKLNTSYSEAPNFIGPPSPASGLL